MGRIGQALARRLLPFGPETMLYSGPTGKPEVDYAHYVSFEHLLERSEFVIATCPLIPDTENLFSFDAFSRMRPDAVFVNISRGEIVDQAALLDALQSKKIAAAGLDVMVPEPLPTNHELLQFENCVVLPHIGSAEMNTRTAMGLLAARNVMKGLANLPLETPVPGSAKPK